jgi:hypothetical protein
VFGVLLAPYVRHGYRFGVGPDVPVYLWWARVAASEGISLVGDRPGVPALIAVIAGTLHLPVAAVVAGLQAALGACIAAGAAALIREPMAVQPTHPLGAPIRDRRPDWLPAALLAGLFSVHLAAGYVSNLVFAVTFLGGGTALTRNRSPRATYVAILLLAGGGLAHPQFFLLGGAILLISGIWAWSRGEGRGEVSRAAVAAGGGGALAVAGLLWAMAGPDISADTSKDGLLRRAGLAESLRSTYVDRLVHRWARYVQWVSIPLAVPGSIRAADPQRRFLLAWVAVSAVGAPVGLATGWYPADRLITFCFAVPILSGIGAVWVWERLADRRWLAWAVAGSLVGWMAAGALIAYSRQEPFISPVEVARVSTAARVAGLSEPGTPLVFVVDDDDGAATFLSARAGNVIRAGMPPDRVDDVVVYVGTARNLLEGRPTARGGPEYDAISRTTLADVPTEPEPVAFVLAPFDRTTAHDVGPGFSEVSPGVSTTFRAPLERLPRPREPLEPSSPTEIVLAAIAVLALAGVAGYGWTRWAFGDRVIAAALAPGVGVGVTIVAAVFLERVGLPLAGSAGPSAVSAVAGAGGYAILVLERRARRQPPVEVG